jgi:hypothetical protein
METLKKDLLIKDSKFIFKMKMIILIIASMTLLLVNTAFSPYTSNNYCTGGTTNWAFNELTSAGSGDSAILNFDSVSAYFSLSNGDSVEIFVRNSVTTTPFTFITFDKATLARTEKICTGATADAGYTFIKLINQFLFLQKSGTPISYYVCQYDETADSIAPIQLDTPSGDLPNPIQNFIPYSASEYLANVVVIDIVFTDGTKSAVY